MFARIPHGQPQDGRQSVKRVLVLLVGVVILLGGVFWGVGRWRQRDLPEDTLARIKAEGVLRWGADPSGGAPFCFNDPHDPSDVVGFEVELVERLARRMGVKAELASGDWNALIPELESRRIDMVLNGLEVTPARADKVAFSTPYFKYVQQVTVRADDAEEYRSLADLRGKPIAVLNGSAAVEAVTNRGWKGNLIVQFDDSLKPFEALKAKRVEAVVGESIIAAYYAGNNPEFLNLPELFSPGVYAAAVRPADTDLRDEINTHLAEMKKSGELGELYQRWGIWSERQEDLGIAKGTPQTEIPLARPGFQFSWRMVLKLWVALLRGAGYTLLLTMISMPLALFFGLVLALMVRSGRRLLSIPAHIYIQVMRGTPLLVQVYVIFFTLPVLGQLLAQLLGDQRWAGLLTWPAFAVGVLCLSANYAAYEAEIHRAGLDAVPKGQREAALSLGMSESQAFYYVILPQSLRIILPPVFNDLISMLKDSCLVSVMGVAELLYVANSAGKATFLYGQMLLAAAVLYLIMSLVADRVGKRLEARLKAKGMPLVDRHAPRH
jgi:polar amino acid transport system substrate-binding protein